ncbi:MAG: M16 family metallopeptidase, partial [Candidatus Bathyanammoxibius sp.]
MLISRCIVVTFMVLFLMHLTVDTGPCAGEGLPSIKYQKATLDNGLRVIIVEHHELPIVAIELLVRAGSVNDPQGRPGLAYLVAQLLREGTDSKSSLEISEGIDFIGGTLRVECDYDSTSAGTTALAKHFRTVLETLSDVTRHPAFRPKEVEFQRDKAITSVNRERDNKRTIARRHFAEMLYGTHPYNHPPIGTT